MSSRWFLIQTSLPKEIILKKLFYRIKRDRKLLVKNQCEEKKKQNWDRRGEITCYFEAAGDRRKVGAAEIDAIKNQSNGGASLERRRGS